MDTSILQASQQDTQVVAALGAATAVPLPFDDASDGPVPFTLTAAARRGVLGHTLPPLRSVPDPVPASVPDTGPASGPASGTVTGSATGGARQSSADASAPVDTRPVQARALLRSGMPVSTIAAALGSDVTEVQGWTEDLVDELARRRRRAAAEHPRSHRPLATREPSAAGDAPAPVERERLLAGLAFALTSTDDHGVSILHDRLGPVAVLLDALREQLPGITTGMRVALRVGRGASADRTAAVVADRLGLERSRMVVGRVDAGRASSMEIRIDIPDRDAARLVRSWRDDPGSPAAELRGWDSNPQTFRLTADCSAN